MVMAKSVLRRDTLREIWRQKSRFLAIFLIVALGAAFFAGIKATGSDMLRTGEKYFADQNLMDARVLSTFGLNEDDITALRETEGVKTVQPAYSLDLFMERGDKNYVIKVMSVPEGENAVNTPRLIEGRMPQAADECVVQAGGFVSSHSRIGETVTLLPAGEEDLDGTLQNTHYTVVGTVQSPLYITFSLGTSSVGRGSVEDYILIPAENFLLEVYTEAYITYTETAATSSFSDAYTQVTKQQESLLTATGETRAQARFDEIYSDAEAEIQDGQAQLDKSKREGEAELAAAKQKLDSALASIGQGQRDLDAGRATLENKIQAGQASLQSARTTLAGLQNDLAQVENTIALYPDESLVPEELLAARTALQSGIAQAQAGIAQGERDLQTARTEGEATLAQAASALASARAQYHSGLAEYNAGVQELGAKTAAAQAKLDDARAALQNLEPPDWYVLSRDDNPGYAGFADDAGRIDAIAIVFPVFFLLVATLVCLTTMTRMVEEQRTQAGIVKALGYRDFSVAKKYLIYAGTAAVSGCAFGLTIGMWLFPNVIFSAYQIMYQMPDITTVFRWDYAIYITLGALACVSLAVLWACYRELREVPASLMRPKAPKNGKRVLLERVSFLWNRLGFIGKVTLRNIFRYKKRIFMTVLGIAGCTALMLTGFGLKDSIADVVGIQYGDLFLYDMMAVLDDGVTDTGRSALSSLLAEDSAVTSHLPVWQKSVDFSAAGRTLDGTLVVPEHNDMDDFIRLRHRNGHEEIHLDDSGLVISEKAASLLGLSVGDSLQIELDGDRRDLPVAAITENYTLYYLYLSPALFADTFGYTPAANTLLVNLAGADDDPAVESLSDILLGRDDVLALTYTATFKDSFGDMVTSLNYVVLVLIVCAGALAFVVLYNLININVRERIREIATIKVLGFTDWETSAYIFRESIILTLLGIAAGLVMGVFLHRFVMSTVEIDAIMFGRQIAWQSFVYAGALTGIFSLLVNFAMHFSLKKVGMVESLKSVE